MQKRTREILALVLLVALLAVGVSAMAYYILVGHNWNVAASNIDDSIGQMDGYTVFLYEGTNPKPYEAQRISDSQPMLDDESRGKPAKKKDDKDEQPVSIRDAADSYREKGAIVFTVDAHNLNRYSEPYIVGKSGKRVAFMSAMTSLKKSKVRKIVKSLHAKGANSVVALTDNAKAMKPLVGEASIIVCDDARSDLGDGEWRGSSYCVGVPYVGEIGAVIESPYGVMSYKTISEL